MKSSFGFTFWIPAAVLTAATVLIAAEVRSGQPAGLTVHEWGTFTSVAGENGDAIEWDVLGGKYDLPRFVNSEHPCFNSIGFLETGSMTRNGTGLLVWATCGVPSGWSINSRLP